MLIVDHQVAKCGILEQSPRQQQSLPGGIPQRYVILILTFLCTCVCYIERVGFSIAYTAVADSAGVADSTKGHLLSAFYYGYASSQVPGGWAAQRFGGRRVLLVSFILWSVTSALTPTQAEDITGVIIARLLVGVAQGFIFPSIHTVLAQWVPPHERSRSVSLTTSGMYFGAAFGMLCMPNLVAKKGPRAVFLAESLMGLAWALLWLRYASDPPGSDGKATLGEVASTAFEQAKLLLPMQNVGLEKGLEEKPVVDIGITKKVDQDTVGGEKAKVRAGGIPWKKILVSRPVQAIVFNNFTFDYTLYVLMNWLPTYFDQGLRITLSSMGSSKGLPYFLMFIMSNLGGIVADYLITRSIFSVTTTRKLLNTLGFITAAVGLKLMSRMKTTFGAIFCSSLVLGACSLARAGFAVNHMDIAPRYAGIVMGVSNTAGTVAGVVGVAATGQILEASVAGSADLNNWAVVFSIPAFLSVLSAVVFCSFASGERIFD
ncbi:hypothetical protein R1flu_001722 [Riccia fluitans]|uniref:Major facilitator superfamily (MFS) profile domain-containing protein n=1 Tax=Riccia fluitans TaxID=41844 RepID=A0ABD1Y722_9MARC